MKDELHSITEFRANIYGMIDYMLESGEPLRLQRHGRIVKIVEETKPKAKKTKQKKYRDLSKIVPMKCMVEDPDWYISPKLHKWSGEVDPNIR